MAKKYDITAMAFNKRGRLISIGKNNYLKTHPLQATFSRKCNDPHKIYLHAEIHALIKAREPVYKLVITRFNADGSPALAKPCPICAMAIKEFGVKVVEHT